MVLPLLAWAGCSKRVVPPVPGLFPLSTPWVATLEGDGTLEPEAVFSPLVTDGKRILVSTRGGFVYSLDLATGAVHWKAAGLAGRLAANPRLAVISESDGTVARLDTNTGQIVWTVETGVAGDLAPIMDAGRVYLAGKGLVCLDVETGQTVWERRDGAEATTTPVSERAFLVLSRADGSVEVIRKNGGRTEWKKGTGPPIRAAAVADEKGRVLLGTSDRYFEALDLRTGERLWRWRIGAEVRSPAVVFDKRVLFSNLENVVYSLDRGKGHMIWRAPLPSRPLFAPHVVGRRILLSCADSDLVALDAASGESAGTASLRLDPSGGATVIRTPILRLGGRMYVGVSNPVGVVALDLPPGAAP